MACPDQLLQHLIRLCSHKSPISGNESRDSGDTKLVSTFPIGVHRIPETTLPNHLLSGFKRTPDSLSNIQ